MRVLYLTNIPAPYRVNFFNELGKLCELTVLFETQYSKERDKKWISDIARNYKAIFMKGIRYGVAESICPEVFKYLSPKKYDVIVVGMYSSPTGMLAIEYMRLRKIKFIINTDGGIIKKDTPVVHKFKQHFIGSASAWLSTGDMATDYLCHYGAKREKVYKYPFTSVSYDDIVSANSFCKSDKSLIKKQLGIPEEKVILTVGRFSYENGYGKGYDTLLRVAEQDNTGAGIYIVGDKPTDEFQKWKEEKRLTNVHYVDFKTKNVLAMYYASADLFVLLSKMDVWELVINEAMTYSLPIIATDRCGAGVELVKNGENGFVIKVGDDKILAEKINYILSSSERTKIFGHNSLEIILNYTIENMASVHNDIFEIWGGRLAIRELTKNKLNISEKKMVISVGQFIYRKGFDILLEACKELDNNIGIYIIGGEPTEEYLNLKEKFELSNVHFVGFMTKDKLADYYKAADVFVLPTREDVWGLVVNEAMAYGLPVVTTDMCGAGLEMIESGENGVIVPVNDPKKLALAINKAFEIDTNKVMTVAREYTIEAMAKVHKQCFDNYLSRYV